MSVQNFFAALILISSTQAIAQNDSGTTRASLQSETSVLPTGWKPFFGLSTGYMTQGGNAETEGIPTAFKGLGSYYTEDTLWVFDIGGGIQHQSMSNRRSATVPMVETSGRYILESGWQVGPILNTYLSDSSRYGSANANFTSFLGAAANKDFFLNEIPLRAGVALLTDLDVRGENVALVVASLQMTFGGETGRQVSENPRAADHLIRAAAIEPPPQKPLANFALESDVLNNTDRAYLRRVASLLKMNAAQFNRVTLVGHTDRTGPGSLNQTLSVARAQSVRSYLVAQGVPSEKLAIVGKAALEPISPELDPNRRVEIRFSSGAPVTLEKSLRSIE